MGLQVCGERLRKQCELTIGQPVDRVCINNAGDGHHILLARTAEDVHYKVDRRTWTATPDPRALHWSTCARRLDVRGLGSSASGRFGHNDLAG